jgi:lysophospholipase L1-like esterase
LNVAEGMQTIVLVGSSIFQAWTHAQDIAPGHKVVNRAVGGTTTPYWKDNLTAVLASEAPQVVLFYCGSNDLNPDLLT